MMIIVVVVAVIAMAAVFLVGKQVSAKSKDRWHQKSLSNTGPDFVA